LRRPGGGFRFLDIAVAASVLLQLAGVFLVPLRILLGHAPCPVLIARYGH